MNLTAFGQSGFEVADIFRKYGDEYRRNNRMSKKQHKVMTAIANCRSELFGYHRDECDQCGHVEAEFNSCRDRHCPKCQGISKRKWINARLADILPVPYYHVVFTLPHLLDTITLYNKKLIYNLLFSSSSETLLTFGRDSKWLGGEIGFYGVLHSGGQTLWRHPHIHYLVPGGALTSDDRWVTAPYRGKFLFPVHALSKVFKGKFIQGLKEAHNQGELVYPPGMEKLGIDDEFEAWINRLVSRDWVVYCKPPFGDAEEVVRYIGRYTHRVAISNSRILDARDGVVSFKYKNYKDNRKTWKVMRLDAQEFIRRFLWHVLPNGFHKIRHFGFLANGRRKALISQVKSLLQVLEDNMSGVKNEDWCAACRVCKSGSMITRLIVTPFCRIVRSVASFQKVGYGKYMPDTS